MKIKFSLMCRRCNALAHDFVFDTENLPNIIGDPQSQLEIFNIELVASQSAVEADAESRATYTVETICKECGKKGTIVCENRTA